MEALAHNPPALKTRRGFNLSSSSSNAIGQPCKGFSLIEAAIVLGVVGLVISAIWVAAANMYENYRVTKTASDLALIVTNTNNLISIRDAEIILNGNQHTSITSTIKDSGVVPKDWINGNGSLRNPFGGSFSTELYRSDINYYLSMIPRSSCIKLLMTVSANATKSGTMGFSLSYSSVTSQNPSNYWFTVTFPITDQEAVSACGGDNFINFTYRLARINN